MRGVRVRVRLQDRVPVTTTKRTTTIGNELHIRELQPTDSGRYHCTASNLAGEESGFFDLRVVGKYEYIKVCRRFESSIPLL